MVMYSAMETNLEPLENRFDIHLRIPAEFEKVFENLQKIVGDADASQGDSVLILQADTSQANDDLKDPFPVNQEVVSNMEVLAVYVWDPGAEDVVMDSCHVLSIENYSVSVPASGLFQPNHHLYPSVSVPPDPRQSTQFSAVVVYVAMETNPSVLDIFNSYSTSTMQHLVLAEISDYSTSQLKHPCVSYDLTQFYLLQYKFGGVLHGQPTEDIEFYPPLSLLRAFPWPGECIAYLQPGTYVLPASDVIMKNDLFCKQSRAETKLARLLQGFSC